MKPKTITWEVSEESLKAARRATPDQREALIAAMETVMGEAYRHMIDTGEELL